MYHYMGGEARRAWEYPLVVKHFLYLHAPSNRCTITFIRQSNILISNYPMPRCLGNETDACRVGAPRVFFLAHKPSARLVSCVCNLKMRRVCEKKSPSGNCMHVMSARMQMLWEYIWTRKKPWALSRFRGEINQFLCFIVEGL